MLDVTWYYHTEFFFLSVSGGAADKDGQLEEGDEIISVNDQPVTNMTRTEAWNFLKKLPEAPVLLKARKIGIIA